MGWHMKLVICVQLAYVSVCLTQLSVVREWISLDVQLPPGDGQESRRSIMPFQVLSWFMYKDRVFVALNGQPYSLAYLDLTDNSTSPLLRPYPSYEDQDMMFFPDKVRVDRCDRLWVIPVISGFKHIIVIDLKTDSILRNSALPENEIRSFDMTIDDFDCDNEYIYISNDDVVWTYSWAEDDSWRHIFSEPIGPMKLAPNSIVYYNVAHRIPRVYYMSTTHLKVKSNKLMSDIRELGRSRKLIVNLALSALDAKSDVLYCFNNDDNTIHAVPCWTSERCSSNCQEEIFVSLDPTHEPSYITLDENGYLWAITRRLRLEDGEINFRLLSVPVKSTCVESNANDTTNTTVPKNTTVNIADTTAGTPNNNNPQVVGGTNMPYLLLSFTNTTFNFNYLSNFTITNFTNN